MRGLCDKASFHHQNTTSRKIKGVIGYQTFLTRCREIDCWTLRKMIRCSQAPTRGEFCKSTGLLD